MRRSHPDDCFNSPSTIAVYYAPTQHKNPPRTRKHHDINPQHHPTHQALTAYLPQTSSPSNAANLSSGNPIATSTPPPASAGTAGITN